VPRSLAAGSAALALALAAGALAGSAAREPFAAPHLGPTGRVLARAAPGVALPALVQRAAALDAELEAVVTAAPLRVLLRTSPARDAAAELSAAGLVEYAVAERYVPMELRGAYRPNDALFAAQWHLENTGQGGRVMDADIDAPEAWAITRGSPEIVIAVLDDGVELEHPDLAPNLVDAGRDFTLEPPGPTAAPARDDDRHGTAVAGVAAARGGNGLGVSGVCPRCRLLPLRVHGASNLGTAAAFRYAVEHGASIITNSWGYPRSAATAADAAVRDAIDTAAVEGRGGRGAVVVFGVTNEPVDNCAGPNADISALPSVIAVGVADHNDELGGAGFGDCLDLIAPSKPKDRTTIGIVTTDRTGLDGYSADDYDRTFGGTSAAAPVVAGVAGLLLSLNPALSAGDVRGILEQTAEKIDADYAHYDAAGFSPRAGYGRVNAVRALVPHVTLAVTPATVGVGEPFAVTVSASAPFGLDSISWQGVSTGNAVLDAPHRAEAGGRAVYSATWADLTLAEPGTFTLRADARDAGRDDPVPGYPHAASDAAPAVQAALAVIERDRAVSR
jgi:subtilisin family serine protease